MTTSSDKQAALALRMLIIISIATLILWNVPFGSYILYPFSILGTWFHEMGHGLTASILGGEFVKLEIYPNGSGIAFNRLPAENNLIRALVSAGGLLGPPIIGSLFILSGKNSKVSKVVLMLFVASLIISVVIWVRTLIGVSMVLVIAGIVALILWKGNDWWTQFLTQLLGTQAVLSTYRQLDYLYTKEVVIDGKPMLSDTGQIAVQLLLPYWFWGTVIALISFFLIYKSLRITYAKKKLAE